jgi:hypothetical protein
MGKKPKSKVYYWLPVLVLFGMFCILGVVMLTSFPKFTKVIPDSPLADIGWTSHLERALKSSGVEVRDMQIVGSLEQQRQLQINISNVVDKEEPQPYYLVSGIHLSVGAGLYFSDTQPRRIDQILVNVFNKDNEYLYSVTLWEPDLRAVIFQEISEQDYLNRWIISGDAPIFVINTH